MTAQPATARPLMLGLSTVAFAIAFNIPFSTLSAIFDYPAVLRRPAGEVLTLFNAGGAELILTWHVFALAALLFVPVSAALSLRAGYVSKYPALSIGGAIAGALAGLAQAIGLWRWVFVVPALARAFTDPASSDMARSTAESTFTLLNLYGGVAIGEHIGQLLTALFVLMLAIIQFHEKNRISASIGFATAGAIAIGTGEGLSIALGHSGDVFGTVTVVGFLLLTAWLISTGITLIRQPRG